MAKAVTVHGLARVQSALSLAQHKFYIIRRKTVRKISSLIRDTAFSEYPQSARDTGALQDSLHYKIVNEDPNSFESHIEVGKENFIRGEGRYTISSKSGNLVSHKTPTTLYAPIIEQRHGFMKSAAAWGNANVGKWMRDALRQAIRGLR